MKRYTLYILVAILGMLNIQPAEAQQKNDQNALYIFRNDGGFNAFFFGDIQRIEYSKIDTLGVEQSDYVVQEIYALDSLFRIPVSAIDSVAFVTPQTKYKADVIRPDKQMTDYIVASDSVSWFRLSASTPSSIIPKVGDKLLIEEESRFIPYGIAGLVGSVNQTGEGYTVGLEEIAVTDLYEQLVVKAAAATPSAATARTRAADEEYVQKIEPWSKSGTISLQGSGELISAMNDHLSGTVDALGSIGYSVGMQGEIRTFLYVDMWGVKTDVYQRYDWDYSTNTSFTGALTTRLEMPLWDDNFILGDFFVQLSAGYFLEGSVSGTYSGTKNVRKSTFQTFGYTQELFGDDWRGQVTTDQLRTIKQSEEISVSKAFIGKGTINAGLYAKAETGLKTKNVSLKVGVGAELGARVETEVDINKDEFFSTPLRDTGRLYNLLNVDNAVTLSGYGNIQGYAKFGKFTFSLKPEYTVSTGFSRGFVPNISSIKWEKDEKAPWRGKLVSPIGRDLISSVRTGFAVYDADNEKDEILVERKFSHSHFMEKPDDTYSSVFDNLETGKDYRGFPMYEFWEYPFLVNKDVAFSLGDPMMNIKPKTVEFDENPGYKDIEVITNIKNTEFTTEAAWLNETKPTWNNEEGRLTVYAPELPDGTDSRKGYVIGVGYDKEGKELLRDTVTVTQLRPILQATPNPVQFEQKGGTVKVALNTTLTQIEAKIQEGGNLDKFFTMTLNSDNTITVTAPENTTGQELSGNIIVKGTSPGGQKAELNLNVIQKGDGGEQSQYWLKISPEEYSFDVNGGTARFIVTDNVPDELINDFEWIASTQYSGDKWFATKWDGDDYLFTAEKNTTGKERTAIITFKLKSEKHNVYIEKAVTLTQSAEAAEESDLNIARVSLYLIPKKLSDKMKKEAGGNNYIIHIFDKDYKISKTGNKYTVTGNWSEKNNRMADKYGSDYAPEAPYALAGDYKETLDYSFTFFKDATNGNYYLEKAEFKHHNHGENWLQMNYLEEGTGSVSNVKWLMESPYGPDHNRYEIACKGEMTGSSRVWEWVDQGDNYRLFDISVNDEVFESTIRIDFK